MTFAAMRPSNTCGSEPPPWRRRRSVSCRGGGSSYWTSTRASGLKFQAETLAPENARSEARSLSATRTSGLCDDLFGAVLFGVGFGGFVGVMRGVEMMGVGGVCVMRRFFVRTRIVMFRRFLVMACRVFVVLCRLPVVVGRFLRHQTLLLCERS